MKKLSAKGLLKEVQSIKKQASSGFFKPYPIEYKTREELESGVESALQDILDGYGHMSAKDITVNGDRIYVRGEFHLELDGIKKFDLVSRETMDYLDSATSSIGRFFDEDWSITDRLGGYLYHHRAALSKNRNERAYIKLTNDYINFSFAAEHVDVEAPDNVCDFFRKESDEYFEIFLKPSVFKRFPEVTISLPSGTQKEDLPKLIMKGLKEFVSKARKFTEGLDDPKYWETY